MLVHLIYDNPTWLIGLILATLWMGGAAIGLLIFHRFVHLEIRKQHNDLAGFMIETVSVTYAVLLAFIA
ncbi:MAG TPA: hypothetical protein VMT58_07340, partial [Candidatus Binataceae bacterium]|nr:hypothetical protein [Candidatus Binataceae bacterium]